MRALGLMALVLVGCGKNVPDAVCDAGASPWTPGQNAFNEATSGWGLTGVEGSRTVAVDFDGDGLIDLHVHRGTAAKRGDFSEEAPRRSWLLRNTGRGFEDVTESSGFRALREGGGTESRAGSIVAFGDVDNDGDLDAITAVTDPDDATTDMTELMINQGDGTFVFGSEDLPFRTQNDVPAGVTFADVNLDGKLDVWMPQNSRGGQPQQDKLYLGDGAGGFTDATADWGLTTAAWLDIQTINAGEAHTNAWSANACDVDGNGWPDLLAASYGRAPNHLWLNGAGDFENASVTSGYAFDENQDFTDNQFFRCWCQANPSGAGCAGVPAPAISCGQINWRDPNDREAYRNGGNSGATSCRDVDNDGDIDLLTGEIQHWWAGAGSDEAQLLINDGTGVFDRPGVDALGLTRELPGNSWDKGDMTNSFIDFDNDGWADVFIGSSDYTGTKSLLWHQTSPLSFTPLSTDDYFEHFRSHGVAVADFDGDGDQDILVGNSRSRCGGATDCYERPQVRLFLNQLAGNFVQIDLQGGEGVNSLGVGARVTVASASQTQTFEVGTSYGHYGAQNPHTISAGLGADCEAEVTVRWPTPTMPEETWTLTAGHRFKLVQGEADPVVLGEDEE